MKIAYERASRCAVTGFTGKYVGLPRIRLHLAIYFRLLEGSLPENTARWQALRRLVEPSVSSPDESPKQRSPASTFDGCFDL